MSFRIDSLYHFPITIPDASLTQDGVMTKEQVALLMSLVAGGGNVFFWDAGKSWATLFAEITGAGGVGIVLIPSASLVTITVGAAYDLSNIEFVGLGARSVIIIDPGVLIDGGASVVLTCHNLFVFGQAPLMTPGAKDVALSLSHSLLSNFFGNGPLFSTSSSNCTISSINSSLENASSSPTTAVLDLAAGAQLTMTAQNGGVIPQAEVIFSSSVFTGSPASDIILAADPISSFDVFSGINGPTVDFTTSQFGRLLVPNYDTSQIPAPSVFRKGNVSYNTDTDAFVGADATDYLPLVRWKQSATEITANYNANYFETVRCNPTGGSFSVILPTAAGRKGYQAKVKNVTADTNIINVGTTDDQLIDGATVYSMFNAWQCLTIESDGANWMIVSVLHP